VFVCSLVFVKLFGSLVLCVVVAGGGVVVVMVRLVVCIGLW